MTDPRVPRPAAGAVVPAERPSRTEGDGSDPISVDPPAPIGRRVFAYLIDVATALGVALVSSGVFFGIVAFNSADADRRTVAVGVLFASAAVGMSVLVWALAYTAMQGAGGSLGQRCMGIRLVSASAPFSTPAWVGFWRALARNIVWAASTVILIGYVTALADPSGRGRGWHDRAAGAVVVARTRPLPLRSTATAATDEWPTAAPAAAIGTLGATAGPSDSMGDANVRAVPPPVPARRTAGSPAPELMTGVIPVIPGRIAEPADVLPTAAPRAPHPPDDRSLTEVGRTRVAAPAAWTSLTWDDGNRTDVYSRTLFGRNPTGAAGVSVVPVRDETLSLSKTHFEIDGDDRGIWVVDRHSTNGTTLVRHGRRFALIPGEPVPLHSGDRLEFGDRSARVGGAG